MRITGGEYRGRKLTAPKGNDVRPTTDMMRQAIFNILRGYGLPDGGCALDAFCGTGALGLEALSHGAGFAVFMDKAAASLKTCSENIAALSLEGKTKVMRGDATKPGPVPAGVLPADLVFLDPPYRLGLVSPSLLALTENGWLARSAVVVIECENGAAIDAPGFDPVMRRSYGDSDLVILQYPAD